MSWRKRSVCPDWTSLSIPSKAAVGDELDEEVIWHLLPFRLALCVISGTSFLQIVSYSVLVVLMASDAALLPS